MADDQNLATSLFGDSDDEWEQPATNDEAGANGADEQANGEGEGGPQDQMKDLFGSDDEDEEAGAPEPNASRAPANDDMWLEREITPPDEPLRGPPLRISVALHDVLATDNLRLAKFSNIIGIEPLPFDPATYTAKGVEYIDEGGNKRVRLHDTNAIRWRWAAGSDGDVKRESNARLVRWSDGSVTLSVGDEVMDVREIDISNDHSFLFARHKNLLQGQGPLTKKITLRPASLTSGSHKRLAAVVERQHGASRQQRVRATTTLVDPSKEKEMREKAEEARIKDLEKLADKQQKHMRRYAGVPAAAPRPRMLNAAYLEGEEDEEGDEYDDGFIVRDEEMEGEDGGYDDEEEEYERPGRIVRRQAQDEDEEEEAERRLAAAKASAPSPVPGGGGGGVLRDSDEDISEDEEEKPAPKKKQRAMVMMESDSD